MKCFTFIFKYFFGQTLDYNSRHIQAVKIVSLLLFGKFVLFFLKYYLFKYIEFFLNEFLRIIHMYNNYFFKCAHVQFLEDYFNG